MKRILFFVAAGLPTDEHKAAATALASATGERVAFRNSTVANAGNETPEACLGVAGDVPAAYAAVFPTYSLDGDATQPEGGTRDPNAPELKLNSLGLPVGCPDNRNDLKDALTMMKAEFHPNLATAKLVDLFRAAIGNEPDNG